MAYNETPTITWDRTTPRDGLLFSAEFARIYDAIANYIVANGGSAPPKTMKAMSDLLDATVNVTGNQTIAGVKTFSSAIVSDVTGDVTGHVEGDASSFVGAIKETGAAAGTIHKKIIEIGDWNMDSTETVTIAHSLTGNKIRSMFAVIYPDIGSAIDGSIIPINQNVAGTSSGNIYANETYIVLYRITGGYFDSTDFNATSYNRGWVTIEYVD